MNASALGRMVPLLVALLALALADPASARADDEEDARIRHLLDRAAFGGTPSLRAEVRRLGSEAWIRQQLDPDGIPDPALEEKLAIHPALAMDSSELLASYPTRRGDGPEGGIGPARRIPVEVAAANLTRAVHAKAQLREVMTDFWFNHFNVFAQTAITRVAIVAYLRDAIRPHALGYFEDLLRATARSPAMLYYLDNYASSRLRGGRGGINENYARELLELHTMGVDGGYGQEDVIEVARAFTGWTITRPRTGSLEFVFVPRLHERGPKRVLGGIVPPGGESEGLEILHRLATHPSTARHVARKILQRLVSDAPPEELVERTAEVFLTSGGHVGRTLESVFASEAFRDATYRGTKVKSPLELVASALRATGSDVRLGVAATRLVADLGQPPLRAEPPTGWPEVGERILSPGGMVGRFEAGYLVVAGLVDGVDVDARRWSSLLAAGGTDGLARHLLGTLPDERTRMALAAAAEAGADPEWLAALVLASPAFQLQ